MNGSAATNEKFDNYSKVENGLFTYTSDENKLNTTTNSNNYSYIDENKLNATTNSNNYSYIDENKLNATTDSNSYINENKLNTTTDSNNYINENKLNTTTDSNNYINENKLNTTTNSYNYINENKLNTTTNSYNYSYIDESLELLNDKSIDPLRRLELKRELVEYISYVKANEPLMLKEYMKKINDTELMKNFHKYFYYNS